MADSEPHEMEISEENAEVPIVPGYKDVNAIVQSAFKAIMLATKGSNELPSAGDDYDYYSSFNSFRDVMDVEGQRILHLMQNVMRYHGAKGNLSTSSNAVEIEDKFDVLTDVNDQILERVGNFLDEAAGIKKTTDNTLVIASVSTPKQISGSWNKKKTGGSSGASYRLLAAKHVQRPQLKFKDRIDNSLRAFVPKIKEKPHAMRPIPESIIQAQQEKEKVSTTEDEEYDASFSYPHPYQFELDHFVPSSEQLEKREPQMPQSDEDTSVEMISTQEQLSNLCELLKKEKEFAVDLEHHSYRSYQGITCLMQISTRTNDYIVDTLELRSELYKMNEVFADPNIVKVFHGADMDIQWLQRDFGIYVVNMFDTGQAARVLNMPRFSLAYLLHHYCNVEADKQYQLADWRIRPLPAELIKYAREDTHYLLYIYDKLKLELLEQGNNQNNLVVATIDRSTQVCAKRYEKPRIHEDSHMEMFIRSKKVFNSRQLAALKGIYSWRGRTARTEDESTGYVLPNHMLLQIAEILPKEMQGILACCNPTPPLVRQSLHVIHRIVKDAREVPLIKPDVYKAAVKPTILQHPRYDSNSLLHCPHDKSQDHKTGRVFPVMEPLSFPGLDSVSETSALFGSQADGIVSARETPIASLFGLMGCEPTFSRKQNAAQLRSTAVMSCFVSPFKQFLPSEKTAPSLIKAAKLTDTSKDEIKWKLLPPTNTEKTPSNPVVEVAEQPVSKVVTDLNEDGAIPLRKQVEELRKKNHGTKRKSEEATADPVSEMTEGKKEETKETKADSASKTTKRTNDGPKSKKNKRKNEETKADSASKTTNNGRSADSGSKTTKRQNQETGAEPGSKPVQSEPQSSKGKSTTQSQQPRAPKIIESWPPRRGAQPGPSTNKKKKLSMKDVEAADFKAHEYSDESFRMFTEKNKRKTKDFNPTTEEMRFKGSLKRRNDPTHGQKNMSFGKNSRGFRTQWPKKM